ncbi:uncharacterized protein N7503_008121 [Penicillium pulvis]|uniref:uncharacterized protein n=1 Tax=Penicillium pulvis TaxID=1562058 RepID=UPI002548C807|nr:uncharacterized protein N7503_008121 [Penicillium pulvis]KAJ5792143.1 hypothetical protein N7503_008121 [Penicillium pulvis]
MSDPSYMSGPSTMSGPYSTPGSYPMPDNFSPPGPYCMPDPQNMSHLYSTSYHLSGPGPGPGPYVMYGPYPSSYHGPSYHIPSPSSLRGPRYTSWPDSHVYDGEIRRDQPEDDPAQRWPLYRGRQERHQKSHDWNPNDLEPRLPGNQILAFDLSATDQKKPQESIESSLRSGRSLDSLYTEPGTNESFDFDTFNKNDAILSPKPRRKKGEIPQDSLAQEKAVTARKMFDPSNLVWTRLDKRRVEEKVLKAGGESFEEHGTYFSILGDLSENKIEEYVRKTTEYRAFHNINTVGRDGTDYR